MNRDQERAICTAIRLLEANAETLRRSYGRRIGRAQWIIDDAKVRREVVETDLAVHDLRTIEVPFCVCTHPTIEEQRARRCAFCEKEIAA